MHPRLEDLLAFRDGEASPETAAHIAACATCLAELEACSEIRSGLRALPALAPGVGARRVVLEAVARRRSQRRIAAVAWAAACLTLAFTLTTGVRGGIETYREAKLARQTRVLIGESQHLEQELRAVRGSTMMSGAKAAVIAELEDRIAAVDARLAAPRGQPTAETLNLWQERVYLLGTLADIRTTRGTYVGL